MLAKDGAKVYDVDIRKGREKEKAGQSGDKRILHTWREI